jgi:hypothetical protein
MKLNYIIYKISVRSSKKTQHFTITKINCLMLFKEMIVVYSVKHENPYRPKHSKMQSY